MPSEILSLLFGYHQEFLLYEPGWRRPLGMKCELKMADDPVDNFVIFDKGDNFHLSAASWTDERIDLIDFFFHLRPAF